MSTTAQAEAAVRDILECMQKPARVMKDGRILAPKLLEVEQSTSDEQDGRLIAALQQVIDGELQKLRVNHFGSAHVHSYRTFSAAERLKRDSGTEIGRLEALSILWSYYIDGLSKTTIVDICHKGVRTVETRLASAIKEIATRILDGSFVRPPDPIPTPAPRLTVRAIKDDLLGRGQFNPVQTLGLHAKVKQHAEGFDFLGIKWTSVFAFTVALVQADGMSKKEIDAICRRFADFNDSLEDNPQGLGVPWYLYYTSFTLSGILCLVYEHDTLPKDMQTRLEQRPGPAYDKGIGKFFWYQSKATTLYWVLDARSGQLYKHLGKQPDKTNMHARWTVKHSVELEHLLVR